MATVSGDRVQDLVSVVMDRTVLDEDPGMWEACAEELALRVSNLLATVRSEDRRRVHLALGHHLTTQEVREALASDGI